MAGGRNWTADEIRQVLVLYLRTPFGRLHARNPEIIALAERLGRTPDAVALKACNLAALDDSLPRRGMRNASRLDRAVWRAFLADPESLLPIHEQQRQRQRRAQAGDASAAPELAEEPAEDFTLPPPEATERLVLQRQRLRQDFFRRMILAAWNERCGLTGIDDVRLLNASHIVAWRDDPRNRLNPRNGICLNTLHDRAFDRYLITFDEDMRMVIASDVPATARRALERVDSKRLALPERFAPAADFLEQHRRRFHARQQAA